MIDTHAHIQFAAYQQDLEAVMARAKSAGVTVVNIGSYLHNSEQAVAMLEQFPETFAVVGLHPGHTYEASLDGEEAGSQVEVEVFDPAKYRALAQHPRVVGIGECGLDYYRIPTVRPGRAVTETDMSGITLPSADEIKQTQKTAFLPQIDLALELDKALVIHCRPAKGETDAYEDMIDIIKNYKSQIANNKLLRFEVHSFTGPWTIAEKIIQLGGFLGLNGIITFDKTGMLEEVVKKSPLEHILLETDAPYLAPHPYRGKRNEPAYVTIVAEKIAQWKGVSVEEADRVTTESAKKLFRI